VTQKIDFKFKLKGFQGFSAALDPRRFKRILEKHVGRATQKIALIAEKQMRATMKKTVAPENAPLTVFIKGSSKPLVDRGDLWQAITSDVKRWDLAFVGILQTDEAYDIAKTIHQGAVIEVTDKMRWMFLALARASEGSLDPSKLRGRAAELWARRPGGWKPLKPDTKAIVIPPRPWMNAAMKEGDIETKAKELWQAAVEAAIREAAQTAPKD
jgi:hypothetical protein